MAGKPSATFIAAMKMVLSGESPYQAAKRAGLALSTMYRNPIYQSWRDGATDTEIREVLRAEEARQRQKRPKKAAKFRLML